MHLDGRARAAAFWHDASVDTPVNLQTATCPIRSTGANNQPRNFGNRSEGFAAKPQGSNLSKILSHTQFTGRVWRHCQRQIFCFNPAAIVYHANQRDAALLDGHINSSRLGIQSILEQLLHDAGWSLNDFACRNPVYH
jgi:hypothetical protein